MGELAAAASSASSNSGSASHFSWRATPTTPCGGSVPANPCIGLGEPHEHGLRQPRSADEVVQRLKRPASRACFDRHCRPWRRPASIRRPRRRAVTSDEWRVAGEKCKLAEATSPSAAFSSLLAPRSAALQRAIPVAVVHVDRADGDAVLAGIANQLGRRRRNPSAGC